MLYTADDDPGCRWLYRPILLRNALAWWYLGISREGWVAWVTTVRHEGAPGPVAAAIRRCYGDIGGIAMLVWGPA